MTTPTATATDTGSASAIEFHPLTVASVVPQTDDSVAVTFDVPDNLQSRFVHQPGQHIVIRRQMDGEDVRRSYSLCSPPGTVRVGIKRIPDGVFSSWATTELKPGDVLDVMAPIGEFTLDVTIPGRYVGIAAGSGITPVLSMVRTALEQQPETEFILVYGNRTTQTIMFLEELEDLKNRFPRRFQVVHVLSREPHQVPLFQGRIDGEKLELLARTLIDPATVDGWYLCGPLDMVEGACATLEGLGVTEDKVHYELFFDQRLEPAVEVGDDAEGFATVYVTMDGRTSVVRADPDGPSILDYARSVRAEIPFACKGGMCATCKARVVDGEVTMAKNYALTDEEIAAGLILTCQAHPVSDEVSLSYDVHGGMGR